MALNPNLPPSLNDSIPWNPEPGAIWGTSCLKLRRNLFRFCFPNKMTETEHGQVVHQVEQALKETLPEITFYSKDTLSSLHLQQISEHFLIGHGLQQFSHEATLGIDQNSQLLALFNLDNHLELHTITSGNQLNETWAKLNRAETQMGKKLEFAFNPKFGYLTADPAECGTGLTTSAYLHLPALVHTQQLDRALQNIEDPDVEFFSLTGDLENLVGDFFIVQNRYTIGMSEENILHAVQSAATKLLSAESVIRDHLKQQSTAQVKDQVSKGFGLLLHSHQLEIKEALDLISLMKLGLAIGLIGEVSDKTLSALFFKCRKGHLAQLFPGIEKPEDIEEKRADFLQKELEGMQFHD